MIIHVEKELRIFIVFVPIYTVYKNKFILCQRSVSLGKTERKSHDFTNIIRIIKNVRPRG